MSKSAETSIPELSGREAKTRRTRIAITEHARKLTALHGLSGFTIEDVCAPADISRRTFFNYFSSKEAAVVGTPPDVLDSDAMRRFMAAGTPNGQFSATVLEDLIEVFITTVDEVLDIAGTLTHVHAIIAREPSFLDKFIADSESLNDQLVHLIAEREGLSLSDARPRLAVQLLGGLLHSTMHDHFASDGLSSIGPKLRETLALTRTLFTAESVSHQP